MFRRILIITAVTATIAGALFAHPSARRARAHRVAECAQITDEQKAAMRGVRETQRDAARPIREELKGAALEYRRLSEKNDAKAKAQLARVRELREELAARRIAMRAEMENVLTPEQRERLESCREERARMREEAPR